MTLETYVPNMRLRQLRDELLQLKTIQLPEPKKEDKIHDSLENVQLFLTAKDIWQELKPKLESEEFQSVMVDGKQGTGKTSLIKELFHYAHADGYFPIYFASLDILDMPQMVVPLAEHHDKLFIVLDDMSYAANTVGQKKASVLKNFVAIIRHAWEAQGRNPRIFIAIIGHFTTSVPPMFKNTTYWVFSAPTHLEYPIMQELVGRAKQSRQLLDNTFNTVFQIRAQAKPHLTFELGLTDNGNKYQFTWDDDGRLMLGIIDSHPYIYHAQKVSCPTCDAVKWKIKVNTDDYKLREEGDKN